MRKSLVAGNWKMNGSSTSIEVLMTGILAGAAKSAADVLVCPPYVYLQQVADLVAGSSVKLGAQDVSAEAGGAFTGDISAGMLKDMGCDYVIVGHSERRAIHGESSQLVAQKFVAAQAAGLIPVLCVGETLEEREAGKTMVVVSEQFSAVLDLAGVDAMKNAVLAYEPVWAIGTGKTASAEQAQEVHAGLRAVAAAQSADVAGGLQILYGGSVKPSNAGELFAMHDIDGGLIGGASLQADDFLGICAAG
jgi:triosephosphate isomerase